MIIRFFKKKKIFAILFFLLIIGIIIIACKMVMNHYEYFNGGNEIYIVKKSDIEGVGVFANKFIKKDERIGLAFEHKKTSAGTVNANITPEFGSLINHCVINDNTYLQEDNNKFYIHAKKNIPKGTELTSNYNNAPDTVDKNVKHFKKC
jgi:SET domain-containing protein